MAYGHSIVENTTSPQFKMKQGWGFAPLLLVDGCLWTVNTALMFDLMNNLKE